MTMVYIFFLPTGAFIATFYKHILGNSWFQVHVYYNYIVYNLDHRPFHTITSVETLQCVYCLCMCSCADDLMHIQPGQIVLSL